MKLDFFVRPALWSFALQRLCTWYPLRLRLARMVAARRPSASASASASKEETEAAQIAAQLERDGISFLPGFVDQQTIDAIKAHLNGAKLRERFPPCRSDFTIDTVPRNVHVAEYDTEHVLRCPEVMALANHPALLAAAARYLGCKPTISNLSIWWSLPADGTAQEAENFHRDVDDWKFVKLFIYLTEVDDQAGPHCFVRGSHRSDKFLVIRRIPDQQVDPLFKREDRLSIHGKPGDAFLEDTFGLHKGQPPRSTRRLLLQVQYSINPIAVYRYKPAKLPSMTPAVDAYVNRLYVA